MSRPRALVLAGPTSAGKSDTALAIAEAYDAVIVSADAMQVYRFLDIGTGKVSADEQQRAVHLGIDVRDPDERFDAASFVELAERALAEHPRVILCGGTSLASRCSSKPASGSPTSKRPTPNRPIAMRSTDYGWTAMISMSVLTRASYG